MMNSAREAAPVSHGRRVCESPRALPSRTVGAKATRAGLLADH